MKVENKAEICLNPNDGVEEKRVQERLTESGRAVYGARSRGGEMCNPLLHSDFFFDWQKAATRPFSGLGLPVGMDEKVSKGEKEMHRIWYGIGILGSHQHRWKKS